MAPLNTRERLNRRIGRPAPGPRLSRGFRVLAAVALLLSLAGSIAHASPMRRTVNAKTFGILESVASTTSGALAVGGWDQSQGLVACGRLLSELPGPHGWQARYSSSSRCAWRSAVAADPRGGAWAVGFSIQNGLHRTLIEHFNGHTWSTVASPSPGHESVLQSVAVAPNHQVWAVGEWNQRSSSLDLGTVRPLTMVYAGSGWHVVGSPSPSGAPTAGLQSVTASASGRLWAVGYAHESGGAVGFSEYTLTMEYGASGWQIVPSPSPGSHGTSRGSVLSAVAPDARGGLWAVGYYTDSSNHQRTLTERNDGRGWTVVASPSPGRGDTALRGVTVASNGVVWAAGSYTGARCQRTLVEMLSAGHWRIAKSPSPHCSLGASAINGMASDRRGAVYAVGVTDVWPLFLVNNGRGWVAAVK